VLHWLLQALDSLRPRSSRGAAAEAAQAGWAVAEVHLETLAEVSDKFNERLKDVRKAVTLEYSTL